MSVIETDDLVPRRGTSYAQCREAKIVKGTQRDALSTSKNMHQVAEAK